MKRRLKCLGLWLASLLMLLVAFLAVEHVRRKLALDRHLKELSTKGERVSLADLKPKRAAAGQNGAIEFQRLTNLLSGKFTNLDNAPPSLRFVKPGKAVVTWRLRAWSGDGKETNDWIKIGAELKEADPSLRLLHSASRKPVFYSDFDYEKSFVDFKIGSLATIKRAAQILNVATDYELSQGRLDAAYEHLLGLVNLVSQKTEPMVIFQLVRQACASLAFNATWEVLQAEDWSDEQLEELQKAWERADFSSDMAASFEMERAMTLDFFRQIKSSKPTLDFVVEQRARWGSLNSFVTDGFILKSVNVPLWRMAWADRDTFQALRRWQVIIERGRYARTNSWSALRSANSGNRHSAISPLVPESYDSESSRFDRFRFLFSSGPFGIDNPAIYRTLTADTQRRMTITAIALRRFHARTGQLPPQLGLLVPGYLAQLPRDDMDGGVLRYQVLPNGEFVLYSVGADGKDDEGDSTCARETTTYRKIWDGRDAVWPSAATAEETAKQRVD